MHCKTNSLFAPAIDCQYIDLLNIFVGSASKIYSVQNIFVTSAERLTHKYLLAYCLIVLTRNSKFVHNRASGKKPCLLCLGCNVSCHRIGPVLIRSCIVSITSFRCIDFSHHRHTHFRSEQELSLSLFVAVLTAVICHLSTAAGKQQCCCRCSQLPATLRTGPMCD